MPFTGTYHHTIDAKGRVIVPRRLRDQLEDDVVVLIRWADGCVALWSGDHWRRLENKLLQQSVGDRDARDALRQIGSAAHQDKIDGQGRITVPQRLIDHAGIERRVVIAGAIDHGEIWDERRWEERDRQTPPERLDEIFTRLDL